MTQPLEVLREAAFALSNACSGGTTEQCERLIQLGLLEFFVVALRSATDRRLTALCVDLFVQMQKFFGDKFAREEFEQIMHRIGAVAVLRSTLGSDLDIDADIRELLISVSSTDD